MTNAVSSPRWRPTPEQVMILEELYRNGIRTPDALHIQRVTAQLSFYGKIAGKNVFYWFQNHKARDRQKQRRKLIKQRQVQQQKLHRYHQHHDKIQQQNLHSLESLGFLSAFSTQQSHKRGKVEAQSKIGQSYKWWMSQRQSVIEQKMMRLCNYDSVVMEAMDAASSSCSNPLKTLELFPTTVAALKEDSNSLQNLYHLT